MTLLSLLPSSLITQWQMKGGLKLAVTPAVYTALSKQRLKEMVLSRVKRVVELLDAHVTMDSFLHNDFNRSIETLISWKFIENWVDKNKSCFYYIIFFIISINGKCWWQKSIHCLSILIRKSISETFIWSMRLKLDIENLKIYSLNGPKLPIWKSEFLPSSGAHH